MGVVLLESRVFIEQRDAHTEHGWDEHTVKIRHGTLGTERPHPELDAVFVLQRGPNQLVVDDTARTAEPEQRGVGATADLDAFRVVTIEHGRCGKVIARQVGASEAAHAGVVLWGAGGTDLVDEVTVQHSPGIVAPRTGGLGVGRVDKETRAVGGVHVLHKIGGNNRD